MYEYSECDVDTTELTELDDEYIQVPDIKDDDVPDGTYQVRVNKVALVRSKTSGVPMLKWDLIILGPTKANWHLWHYNILKKENMKWVKRDLYCCGLELEKISDLPNNLEELLDIHLEVRKKTNGDFENIYFNRRIDTTATNQEVTEDDVPF